MARQIMPIWKTKQKNDLLLYVGKTRMYQLLMYWTYEYSQAQIKMPDGTVIEGKVDSWNDYEGDQLQVKINGTTYLAHSSNVVLWH